MILVLILIIITLELKDYKSISMNKIQCIINLDDLLKTCEDVLKTKYIVSGMFGDNEFVNDEDFQGLKEKISLFLSSKTIFEKSYESFSKEERHYTNYSYTKKYKSILNALKNSIENNIIALNSNDSKENNKPNTKQQSIFIGHGHSNLWNQVIRMLKDDCNFNNCIYFEKNSQSGKFIGEALNEFKNDATFAIIVMTAEDETKEDKLRARQNVIHEIGFFQGKLGFDKVAILKQDDVESFSNIDGLQYIPFTGNNINQTFYDLQKMLKRENLI